MSNEISYKERLLELNEWMEEIVETVKKDLKADHLKKDYAFVKKYFPGKNLNKIESKELTDGYIKAIREEESETLAEFIIHRWIFRNSEIYHFFEERLSKINAEFSEIKELTSDQAAKLEQEAVTEFGAIRSYLFSWLNGVAFSKEILKKLEQAALKEKSHNSAHQVQENEKQSLEDMKTSHSREIARLTDKYEKKLLGFQKKYSQDMDMLKKQLANVQRKLTNA